MATTTMVIWTVYSLPRGVARATDEILAGEALQKFSNYKVQLAIVGEFSQYPGQSIKDFIFESNKGKLVNFLPDVESAKERLFRWRAFFAKKQGV